MSDRSSREFADRFFERQRKEILDRILAGRRRRRDLWSAVGLAAAAVVVAAAVFLVVARGTGPAGAAQEPALDWLAEAAPAEDALAIFASWEEADDPEPMITALPELGDALEADEPLGWFDPHAWSLPPATGERG